MKNKSVYWLVPNSMKKSGNIYFLNHIRNIVFTSIFLYRL